MLSSKIKTILEQYGVRPNKLLGQNFLMDENVLNDLIEAAELGTNDTVLEVGGGVGTVTRQIAQRVERVVSVEKDKQLVPILKDQTKDLPNVEIVEGDILKFSIFNFQFSNKSQSSIIKNIPSYKLQTTSYKLVGTPPYYLTARLFRTFLEETPVRPSLIALIIQKEVAQKICAKPPRASMLALSVQVFGEPKITRTISRNAFWPEPEVESALLVVCVYPKPLIEEQRIKDFFRIAKAAFAHPRQQLHKTLSGGLGMPREQIAEVLASASIDGRRRPQTLSIDEWKKLVLAIALPKT